jgi:hypothetical protein
MRGISGNYRLVPHPTGDTLVLLGSNCAFGEHTLGWGIGQKRGKTW